MIDEDSLPQRRPRVNVDPGQAVGIFGHHAGNQRRLNGIEHMSQPLNGDRLDAGVTQNDLVVGNRGRIPRVRGRHVGLHRLPDLRQRVKQGKYRPVGPTGDAELAARLLLVMVMDRPADLIEELRIDLPQQQCDIFADPGSMVLAASVKSGKDHL